MILPSGRLAELGLELPPIATPVITYVPTVLDRSVIRTSDQTPVVESEPVCIGAAGEGGVNPENAKDAMHVCALNALATAAALAGGVDHLAGVAEAVDFIASRPDFYARASVVNGASELFGEILGSAHARNAVSVAALPLSMSAEVEAEFALVED